MPELQGKRKRRRGINFLEALVSIALLLIQTEADMQVHELGVSEENKEKTALSSCFNLFSQTKVKLPFECRCRRANNIAFMFQGSSLS